MDILLRLEEVKNSGIRSVIADRMREFAAFRDRDSGALFRELSFCFLTANFNAMRSIKIQEDVGEGFLTLSRDRLVAKLREHGHRFPEARADYIVAARIHAGTLKESLQSLPDETEAREWVVRTFRGIGYKEASHFLRNIGYQDLAIIDFHIIDLLVRHRLIERPKTLTKSRYLDIESVLGGIAGKAGLSLAELDLYLWFMETGKVLK